MFKVNLFVLQQWWTWKQWLKTRRGGGQEVDDVKGIGVATLEFQTSVSYTSQGINFQIIIVL